MDIKVFSTATCPYCHMAKDYLKAKNIPFVNIDVASDAQGLDEMRRLSGQMGVPVIVIDNQVIVGFDKPKIDAAIGK
jgi:glutaredoxin 3